MHRRPGFTLLELTLVLTLATLFVTLAVPTMLRGRHIFAVRAARAELTATIAAARSAAIMAGGVNVVVDIANPAVWIETLDGIVIGDTRQLGHSHGVALVYGGGPILTLRYDALGIGRLANASIRIQRGQATSTVTISAYGRVRS